MAKRKNSVALFEVIQKTKRSEGGIDVPEWMGDQAPMAGESVRQEQPGRMAAATPAARLSEPLFAVAGDRLRLSLDYVSCGVAALVLVLLLCGAFALGFWAGSARAPEAKRLAGTMSDRTPIRKDVLGGAGSPGGEAATTRAGGLTQRQKGKSYLVIQAMNGATLDDYQDASQIVDFCEAQGERASVVRYTNPATGTKKYVVWSLEPFDSAGSNEARAYARKIEGLGEKYKQAGGRYNFQQRATRGGEFDPWFLTYR